MIFPFLAFPVSSSSIPFIDAMNEVSMWNFLLFSSKKEKKKTGKSAEESLRKFLPHFLMDVKHLLQLRSELHHLSRLWRNATEIGFSGGCFFRFLHLHCFLLISDYIANFREENYVACKKESCSCACKIYIESRSAAPTFSYGFLWGWIISRMRWGKVPPSICERRWKCLQN